MARGRDRGRGVYNEALPVSWCLQPDVVTVVAEVPLWPGGRGGI